MKALAGVFRHPRPLNEERYTSISKMAAAERIDRGHLGRILQLTFLAPDLVEDVLNGGGPVECPTQRLMAPFLVVSRVVV